MSQKFPCPCCSELTLESQPPGSYEICKKCQWEDDPVQFRDPDYTDGANTMSLNQARRQYNNE